LVIKVKTLNNRVKFRTKISMHCCNINKGRRGDFFWFTWYIWSCLNRKFIFIFALAKYAQWNWPESLGEPEYVVSLEAYILRWHCGIVGNLLKRSVGVLPLLRVVLLQLEQLNPS